MRKRGISLIVLIITIIVVIILAAVVILTISKNNPIESAKEARFKEDVRTFQDELALAVSKEYANAGGHRDEKITTADFDEIREFIPSFSEKYRDKFVIQDDELKYTNKLDDNEKEYAQNLNVKEKPKLLPDEYQQVEYIESTGTQYIDTKVLNKCGFISNIGITPINTSEGVFIGTLDENLNRSCVGYTRGNTISFQVGDNYYDFENTVKVNSFYDYNISLVSGNSYMYSNDEKITSMQKEYESSPLHIHIFARNAPKFNKAFSKIKLHYCVIYSENVLKIRDFIPCYSTITVTDENGKQCPSGTKGLYDTVEGKFYTNQGTGEFIVGPDVNE